MAFIPVQPITAGVGVGTLAPTRAVCDRRAKFGGEVAGFGLNTQSGKWGAARFPEASSSATTGTGTIRWRMTMSDGGGGNGSGSGADDETNKPWRKREKRRKPQPQEDDGGGGNIFGRLKQVMLRPIVSVPGTVKGRDLVECVFCEGEGFSICLACNGTGKDSLGTCFMCDGKGYTKCTVCNGVGMVDVIRRGGTDDKSEYVVKNKKKKSV